ncbi:hypothetical protein AJ78_00625 [Emergomyces pasteurianus Ep9510]|uniref:Uncharacterized protein n=1 Tax=Emergomyces pasteurianus Ep9510 TaxID=1447872 RepID=A0A1J9QGX8_9EURO|nr:hypothetical protein AJ78_00625 [Emergomyces pasteurianus Ep9510]
MRPSISIILFVAVFSTITNSFPLPLKAQPQVARRRAHYSVVLVDGGPKSTTSPHSGLLVTIPPRFTETVVSTSTVPEPSSPAPTERSSLEQSYLSTLTTATPSFPPRTTPSASVSTSSGTAIYIPSSSSLRSTQPVPTGGFRFQPSHTTIRISSPTHSLIPPQLRYGSNNGTYHLPTPSTWLPN